MECASSWLASCAPQLSFALGVNRVNRISMSFQNVLQSVAAFLVALGSGGAIVVSLSGYLGKLWAERFLAREKAGFEEELERLRAELTASNAKEIEHIRTALDVTKTKVLSAHADKVQMYRLVADIVSGMLSDIAFAADGARVFTNEQATERLHQFNCDRLRAYGYLAMFAPQHVMDAYDRVIDHLFAVLERSAPYDFARIRALGIAMLNEIRIDLGIDPMPIAYRGDR